MSLEQIKTDKYKNYRIKYNEEHKEEILKKCSERYFKKIAEDPSYKLILSNRTKARQQKKREELGPRPRGRPKKNKEEKEPEIKKIGRPRKYIV